MLNSLAWLSLSAVARCVFIELAARYKGGNNGYLALSCGTLPSGSAAPKTPLLVP
jgi:hypothetical protein